MLLPAPRVSQSCKRIHYSYSFEAELFSGELVQGAGEGDEGLAAFVRAAAPRTERIRQRFSQESQSQASSDDEHDDYGMDISRRTLPKILISILTIMFSFVGFHRRPNVRGVSVKQQLGASNEILQQMQNELQPSPTASATPTQPHACQRTTSNYSWPYYSEANLNSRPQSRASASSTWYVF